MASAAPSAQNVLPRFSRLAPSHPFRLSLKSTFSRKPQETSSCSSPSLISLAPRSLSGPLPFPYTTYQALKWSTHSLLNPHFCLIHSYIFSICDSAQHTASIWQTQSMCLSSVQTHWLDEEQHSPCLRYSLLIVTSCQSG